MTPRTVVVLAASSATSAVVALGCHLALADSVSISVNALWPVAFFVLLITFAQHIVRESTPFNSNEAMTKRDAEKARRAVENLHSSCWGLMLFFVAAGALNIVASVLAIDADLAFSMFAGTGIVAVSSLPWLVTKHFEIIRFAGKLAALKRDDGQRQKLLKGMRDNGGAAA